MGDEVGGDHGVARRPRPVVLSVAPRPFASLTSKLEAGVSWEFESKERRTEL